MSLSQPPLAPKSCAVAILDLLGYKELLGNEKGAAGTVGLASLYETMFLWLTAVEDGRRFDHLSLTPAGQIVQINEVVSSSSRAIRSSCGRPSRRPTF